MTILQKAMIVIIPHSKLLFFHNYINLIKIIYFIFIVRSSGSSSGSYSESGSNESSSDSSSSDESTKRKPSRKISSNHSSKSYNLY